MHPVFDALRAFSFGLTLSMAIGPIAFLIMQRSVTNGVGSGISTAVGVAFADGIYALLTFSVGATILTWARRYELQIQSLSAVLLMALAGVLLLRAMQRYGQPLRPAQTTKNSDFLSALILTAHNPLTLSMFLGFAGQTHYVSSLRGIVVLAALLFCGSLTGQVTIACASVSFRRFITHPTAILTFNIASAIGIASFGIARVIS